MGAFIGGEDGPVHAGESFFEEGGGESDDAMVGLEPGDELFAAGGGVDSDQTEADEGVHFVDVAADGLAPVLELADIGVGGDGEKMAFAAEGEPPEDAIEQGPAFFAGVGGGTSGEIHEGGRHGDGSRGGNWW